MPKVTVQGEGTFDVPEGKKLVLAIEDAGVDISHRCGGQAKCTTCRVKFGSPEPPMSEKEKARLEEDGVLGLFRLSCQIRAADDMEVDVLMRAKDQGWEPGPRPED
jgi:ferredoxin